MYFIGGVGRVSTRVSERSIPSFYIPPCTYASKDTAYCELLVDIRCTVMTVPSLFDKYFSLHGTK